MHKPRLEWRPQASEDLLFWVAQIAEESPRTSLRVQMEKDGWKFEYDR